MATIKTINIIKYSLLFCMLLIQVNASAIDFTIDAFIVEGDNPLSKRQTEQILSPYIGNHTNIVRLREATKALEKQLLDDGYAFHRVSLPPQTLKSGQVKLEVFSLKVGNVSVLGNNFFSEKNLKNSLPQLKAGQTPNNKKLTRVLAVVNANTAKRTQLTFGRGEQPNTMDAQIEVNDTNPVQVYSWINNSGNDVSTNTRLGIGYAHRNVADKDHQFNFSATISPEDTEKVKQYGISYRIPIYSAASIVDLFYAESDINTGRVADVFDVSGGGQTSGFSYTSILNKVGPLRQKVQIKLFDKLFDNNIDFQGNEIGQDVRSRPLSFAYQNEWREKGWSGLFNVSHSINQSGGSLNDDAVYAASRVGAVQAWQKTNLKFQLEHASARQWKQEFSLSSQSTSDALIAGEKMGLGGFSGPRGFEEREATFDEAYLARLAFWMPPIYNLSFGSFYNIGHGTIHLPQSGETASDTLSSVGLGLRWNWRSKLLMEAYYAHVLDGIDAQIKDDVDTIDGDWKFHFNLVYRF